MKYKSEFDKLMEEFQLEQLGTSLGIDGDNLSASDIDFLEMLEWISD